MRKTLVSALRKRGLGFRSRNGGPLRETWLGREWKPIVGAGKIGMAPAIITVSSARFLSPLCTHYPRRSAARGRPREGHGVVDARSAQYYRNRGARRAGERGAEAQRLIKAGVKPPNFEPTQPRLARVSVRTKLRWNSRAELFVQRVRNKHLSPEARRTQEARVWDGPLPHGSPRLAASRSGEFWFFWPFVRASE